MEKWSKLLWQENLTEYQLKQIPARCHINNLTGLKRYRDNGWDTSGLTKNLPFSLEELVDENCWSDPIQTYQTDVNYFNNLPEKEPHFSLFALGEDFFRQDSNIHKLIINLLSYKQILKRIKDLTTKFNNQYTIHTYFESPKRHYYIHKPYPYMKKWAMGHDCHFIRGIYNGVLGLKKSPGSSVTEILCSVPFENILDFFYPDLKSALVYEDGTYSLNGLAVATEREMEISVKYPFLSDLCPGTYRVLEILAPLSSDGKVVFKKGEIFNAPVCLFEFNVLNVSLFKEGLFASLRSRTAIKLEEQLKIAQEKNHETNQIRKLLEEEIKKKDEFLENTAHELKTPLAGIIGLTESLLEREKEREISGNLSTLNAIYSSSMRLSMLVNDIMDINMLKNRTFSLNQKSTDIHSILSILISLFKPITERSGVVIINSLPMDFPYVFADENRLSQVLFNLVNNAVKYSNNGLIEISGYSKNNRVYLSVRDDGPGIDSDQLPYIFQRYHRGSSSDSGGDSGLGLGLYLSKKIIEEHGGDMQVVSERMSGTCFTFSLPVSTDSPELNSKRYIHKEESSGSVELTESKNNNFKIMVIDDESINGMIVERFLEPEGFNVYTYLSPENILDKINMIQPDIILLDLIMPNFSGIDICQQIREKYSKNDLPVLIFTSRNLSNNIKACFDAGCNDYLTKPLHKEELLARIGSQIELRYHFLLNK